MDFSKIKKIHFIGIGGIGLSAIAKLMLVKNKRVSGSDIGKSAIVSDLRNIGADIFIGHKAENLADDCELLIYTLAVPESNPELIKAKKLKIGILTYPEALAILFNDKFGIAICGTHGKSTTTSLVGLVLADGGSDPSVVVGSKVPAFGGNLRVGKSGNFVIEACEYERAFLKYWPKIIVLNNIELDHTDYYKDIEDYRGAFIEFVGHLPEDGVLIFNGDDRQIENLKIKIKNDNVKLKNYTLCHSESASRRMKNPVGFATRKTIKIISFGVGENNGVKGYDIKFEAGQTKFKVNYLGKEKGEFMLKIPGKFNVYNALAAIAVGLHLGIDAEKIRKTLAEFGGIWRRFEIKGSYKNTIVVSDYAHHPTAVKSTIGAARGFYPGRRIFAVFQPHQHNRTRELYQDFLKSFDSADAVILVEIFSVAGREEKEDQNVSSQGLAEDIKNRIGKLANGVVLQSSNIFYAANLIEARRLIDEKIKAGDILLIMGAGDIFKVADELVGKLKNKN